MHYTLIINCNACFCQRVVAISSFIVVEKDTTVYKYPIARPNGTLTLIKEK